MMNLNAAASKRIREGRPNVLERRMRLTNALPSFSKERKAFMSRVLGKDIQLHSANKRDVTRLEETLQTIFPPSIYDRFWAYDATLKDAEPQAVIKAVLVKYLAEAEAGTGAGAGAGPAVVPAASQTKPKCAKSKRRAAAAPKEPEVTLPVGAPSPAPEPRQPRPRRAAARKAMFAVQAVADAETDDDVEEPFHSSEDEAYIHDDDDADDDDDEPEPRRAPFVPFPVLAPAPLSSAVPGPVMPVTLGKRERAASPLMATAPASPFAGLLAMTPFLTDPQPLSPLGALPALDDPAWQLEANDFLGAFLLPEPSPVPTEAPVARSLKRGRVATLTLPVCSSCPSTACAAAATAVEAPVEVNLALADDTPLEQVMMSVAMARPAARFSLRAVYGASNNASFPIQPEEFGKTLAELQADGVTSFALCRGAAVVV